MELATPAPHAKYTGMPIRIGMKHIYSITFLAMLTITVCLLAIGVRNPLPTNLAHPSANSAK